MNSDEVAKKSLTWSPRESAPPHPLMSHLARNYLNNFVQKLPQSELDALLQPIRSGVLDYNTVLTIKDPATNENVSVKASDLIAILGAPEKDEGEDYETLIDDDVGYYDVAPRSGPAVRNSPLIKNKLQGAASTLPALPSKASGSQSPMSQHQNVQNMTSPNEKKMSNSSSFGTLPRYIATPTATPQLTAKTSKMTPHPAVFTVEELPKPQPTRSKWADFMSNHKKLIIVLIILLLLIIALVILLVVFLVVEKQSTDITVTVKKTITFSIPVTPSATEVPAEFTYDVIDNAIVVTQQISEFNSTTYVMRFDVETLETMGVSHWIHQFYSQCGNSSSTREGAVYSLMGCKKDPCILPTTYKLCTDNSVSCVSSVVSGIEIRQTVKNAERCGIWSCCNRNGNGVYFCAKPMTSNDYRDYAMIHQSDGGYITLPEVKFCENHNCNIRSRGSMWHTYKRDPKTGDHIVAPGISMASKSSMALLINSTVPNSPEDTAQTYFAEFSINNHTDVKLERSFKVGNYVDQVGNPWRDVPREIMLHKIDQEKNVWFLTVSSNRSTVLQFASYDKKNQVRQSTYDYSSSLIGGFQMIGQVGYENNLFLIFEKPDSNGKVFALTSLEISIP